MSEQIEEWLQIIKQKREAEKQVPPGMKPSVHIDSKDIDWLIEQAEQMQILSDKTAYTNEKGEPKLTTKELMIFLIENKILEDRIKDLEEHLNEIIGMRNMPDEVLKIAKGALEGKS